MGHRARRLLLANIIAVGLVLRAWHWLFERSLWIDEARVALNVLGRSFTGLAEPLWFDQSAPLLFLWATKLVAMVAGTSEAALRFVPMLAGILALPLAYRLGRAVLSVEGAIFATTLVAVSPVAIYYSNELKPYSTDVVLTLAVVAMVVRMVTSTSTSRSAGLLPLGVIAAWASASMFFVLPACALAICLKDRSFARRHAGAAVAMICSAAAAWLVVYRPLAGNAYLSRYWAFRFWGPGELWEERVWSSLVEVVGGALLGAPPVSGDITLWASMATGVTLAVTSIGLLSIRARSPAAAVALFVPLGLLAAGALLDAYPFSLRVSLFALPLIVILFAAGIEQCLSFIRANALRRTGWVVVCLGIAGPLFIKALADAAHPEVWAPVKTLVRELRATGQAHQPVYVSAGMLPTWVHYTTDWSRADRSRLEAVGKAGSSGGYALENGGRLLSSRLIEPPGIGSAGGVELWGRSTGLEWSAAYGFTYSVPYTEWADREAERIVAVAQPTAWLVSSRMFGTEAALHRAVEEAGLCESLRVGDQRANAVLFRRGRCATGSE